jgi:DNA (cytosine-5)-methyltransferase 1
VILDLFAGPGGWDQGAKMLGLDAVGLEWDHAACMTAVAAGHPRIRCDVAQYPTAPFVGKVTGLIASPPCTDFSTAGAMRRTAGNSGHLVLEVMRWAEGLNPEWIAAEQVPAVLSIWQEYAARLRNHGFRTWTGILNAADYGVPQERRRAILLASQVAPVTPPVPTHVAAPHEDLFGVSLPPWVTLAETCDLPPECWYDSGQNSRAAGGGTVRYIRSCDRPAGTLTGKTLGQWVIHGGDRRKLTTTDGAALQTFPPDYPWCGSGEEIEQQIGNAVPPLLAAHVLAALTGAEMRAAA